jgi:S1-C subfamily serine protease
MYKATALAVSLVASACLVAANGVKAPTNDTPQPAIKVRKEYRNNFASTCAIGTTSEGGGTIRGTGVLLKSGIIITNKHVVDVNANGRVSGREKTVTVWFYTPEKIELQGTVELVSEGNIRRNGTQYDLAFIRVEHPPESSVTLIDAEDYLRLEVGEELYALGFPVGEAPAHMTTGVFSTTPDDRFGRCSVSIYFGNSGGGLFQKSTGKLIGINTRIRGDWRGLVPGWSEFMPAHRIVAFLLAKDKLSYLDPSPEKKFY